MNKIILFLFPFFSIASYTEVESVTFKIKIAEETITYLFSSIHDFEENYEKLLDDFEQKENKGRKKNIDTFWVEISITLNIEKESTTITRSINSSETTIKEDMVKLKKQVFGLLTVM